MVLRSKAPSLNAQVVLFETPLQHVWRLLEGLSASVRHAQDSGVITSAVLSIADCSSLPVLRDKDLEDLSEHAEANGLAGFDYRFLDANLGHSGGHNILARSTTSDLLIFLNPDTYPAPNMLSELLPVLEQSNVGLAEARQIPLEHPKEFDPSTGDTSWASGCCLAAKRDIFLSVGGFDESNFPVYCNDVDLSWRLRLRGYRAVLIATAVVFHDKQIAPAGQPVPAPTERYYSALGRLLLATRYGRYDIVAETKSNIEFAGDREQIAALDEFRRREKADLLPEVLSGADNVAQFVGGEYARHRF